MTGRETTEEALPHKTAEEMVRTSEEKYRLITENMRDVIWQTTPDLVITYVTSSVKKLLGYEPQEVVGKHVTHLLTSAGLELLRSRYPDIMRRLAEHKEFDSEVSVAKQIRKDGTTVWTEVVTTPAFGSAGQFIGFQGVTRDISKLKEDEDALRVSEEKYRNLVESISDVIFEIDGRGALTYISPVIRNVVGYEAEDLIGRAFLEFVHPEDSDLLIKRFSELTEGVEHPLEYRLVGKSGEVRYVRTYTRPIIKDNIFEGARGTLIDITERKRMEEERLEMERKLLNVQKLESLNMMAGGIAHDFNNQLAIVLGNLELALADRALDPEVKLSIKSAAEAAKRSAELSRQIQIYTGNTLYYPADLDLKELLTKNRSLLKLCISKYVTFNLEIYSTLPPIKGDADQIQCLIMNILANASEAIGDKEGEVRFSTGVVDCDETYLSDSRLEKKPEQGRFVFLEVTDTGCGMDLETLRRLFDPFFTTKFLGRGLGMAEVMGIVKGHQGALMVVSQIGKGSTIRVLFPVSKEAHASSIQAMDLAETQASATDIVTGRKMILIVENEAGVRDLFVKRLEVLGYNTIIAVDGKEGISVFRERVNEIDLVMLDFAMPKMNGVEAFGELILIKPDVKVMLCSGYTEDVVMESFPSQRPDCVLHKPYNMEALKHELERLLG